MGQALVSEVEENKEPADQKSPDNETSKESIQGEMSEIVMDVIEEVTITKEKSETLTVVMKPESAERPKSPAPAKMKEANQKEPSKVQTSKTAPIPKGSALPLHRSVLDKRQDRSSSISPRKNVHTEIGRLQREITALLSMEIVRTPTDDSKAENSETAPSDVTSSKDDLSKTKVCNQCSGKVRQLEEQRKYLAAKLIESEKHVLRMTKVLAKLRDTLRLTVEQIQAHMQLR